MKKVLTVLILLTLTSCTNNPESFIEHLNGYWEIEEVTLADGTKKEYTYNDTVDFISINDSLIGFRKKLKPNFSGTFQTSSDAENLKVVIENNTLNLYYTTPFGNWKEIVLNVTKDKLLIENEAKVIYLYKRYQPLELD